jgi:putative membrane protein
MDSATRLAVDRTRLAHERTLMAWIRTAVSMISFGFTIYKFFQFELQGGPQSETNVLGPRGFALIMIAIAVLALFVAMIQHRQSLRAMRAEYVEGVPLSLSALVAALVTALGLIALIAVGLRR